MKWYSYDTLIPFCGACLARVKLVLYSKKVFIFCSLMCLYLYCFLPNVCCCCYFVPCQLTHTWACRYCRWVFPISVMTIVQAFSQHFHLVRACMCYFFKKVTTFCKLYIVGVFKIFNLGLCAVFFLFGKLWPLGNKKLSSAQSIQRIFVKKIHQSYQVLRDFFFEIMFGRYVS